MQGHLLTSVAERRARLVVQCACELLGIDSSTAELQLPLSVAEFEVELRNRFGAAHPDLVFRTDSTLERARAKQPPTSASAARPLKRPPDPWARSPAGRAAGLIPHNGRFQLGGAR